MLTGLYGNKTKKIHKSTKRRYGTYAIGDSLSRLAALSFAKRGLGNGQLIKEWHNIWPKPWCEIVIPKRIRWKNNIQSRGILEVSLEVSIVNPTLPAVFILSACNEKKKLKLHKCKKVALLLNQKPPKKKQLLKVRLLKQMSSPTSSETTMDNNATQDLVTQAIEAVDNPEQMQQLIEQNAETIKNMADTLTEGGTEAMQEALTNALQSSN